MRARWVAFPLLLAAASSAFAADPIDFAQLENAARLAPSWEAAIQIYSKALAGDRLKPADRAAALERRGRDYLASGQREAAVADFDAAIALQESGRAPAAAGAYVSRGQVRMTAGDAEKALADFDAAVRIAPGDTRARHLRAVLDFALAKFAAAARDFERLDAIDPRAAGEADRILWRHLARARAGENDAAAFREAAYGATEEHWLAPVMAAYLGRRDPAELSLKPTEADGSRLDPAAQRIASCEVAFFVGELYLLRRDRTHAEPALAIARSVCPGNDEWYVATAELARR